MAEVYPALWKATFPIKNRTPDQHDAFTIVAWLSCADREGRLASLLTPDLTPEQVATARVEACGDCRNTRSAKRVISGLSATALKGVASPTGDSKSYNRTA